MSKLQMNPRLAQWAVEATARLLATYSIFQGGAIYFGGAARWPVETYHVALLLPGAPATWGVALAIFGATALIGSLLGRYTPVIIGMAGGGIWSLFFTISFTIALLTNPLASSTAPWVYATMSILFILLAILYRDSRKIARSWRAVHPDYSR